MFPAAAPTPNPALIAWAREQGGYDVPRIARRLQVKPQQVELWEAGAKPPTVRQLINLANFYHRPLSLFFESEAPRQRPYASEYRRLPAVSPGAESPELRLAIRHMLARRDIALDLLDEMGLDVPEFNFQASSSEPPRVVGERLRSLTGITSAQQGSWRDGWQAWREWRTAIEGIGVLVFMFPKVEFSETRGLALLRFPLPVAAVNTKEVVEARAFTALHEVIHLALANAHEEGSAAEESRDGRAWEELELFVEEAASFALVDEASLAESVPKDLQPSLDTVRRLAQQFRVTSLAMATRLWRSGYFTWPQYNTWKVAWDTLVADLAPSKSGFATPVSKTLGRSGQGFSRLVLDAFDSNRITTAQAAHYLNLRTDQFDDLRQRLTAGATAGKADE
ncbi:MAG: XRE family transcriptional regulator [Fimbriimonadaceae bacterium]